MLTATGRGERGRLLLLLPQRVSLPSLLLPRLLPGPLLLLWLLRLSSLPLLRLGQVRFPLALVLLLLLRGLP